MFVHRFIIVGIYNTIMGYLIFVGLNFVLSKMDFHYLVILTISYIFSVTHAYVTQRIVVFRSKGKVTGEYPRFFLVNLLALGVNAILLHGLMQSKTFGFDLGVEISQAIALGMVTMISFWGHKFFSFSVQRRVKIR